MLTIEIPSVYIFLVKNDYVHNVEKVTKNNLTIISKSHAHSHTMKKTHANFKRANLSAFRTFVRFVLV